MRFIELKLQAAGREMSFDDGIDGHLEIRIEGDRNEADRYAYLTREQAKQLRDWLEHKFLND